MDKKQAVKIITECAGRYHKNLENRNLLFLFGKTEAPEHFEAAFLPRNYLHLTGVQLSGKKSSSDFYEKALKGKLSPTEFSFAQNGTTVMKLLILPQLMNIQRLAKMVGNYDPAKPMLYTEKIAGNVNACMGFVKEGNYYVPNTAIKEDVRNLSKKPRRMLAIFRKGVTDTYYTELCYVAKGVEINDLKLPEPVTADKKSDR